jgi:NtrC-family two-component system response regulator AlgB
MSGPGLDILVVDDEPNLRQTLGVFLERRGHRVRSAADAAEALAAVAAARFDLAFVDVRLGTSSGLDLVPRLRRDHPAMKIVVITAYASVETAVEAMKRGAHDYLPKPFLPAQLDLVIEKLRELDTLERRVRALRDGSAQEEPAVRLESASPAMREVLRVAAQAAAGDGRILLRGESGTGKGVLARWIHEHGPRRERPFVVVPCPALPAELVESELFGHVRGAFTGASRDSTGRVALAEGGTLLLDEIGDLPPALQPKLLRFIEERTYERVGDPTPRHADVRILAATHRDLEVEARAGRFREDLYYRLAVLTLEIPPLRDRPEDVLPLAEGFVAFLGRRAGRPGLRLAPAARRALLAHRWPGNVRELLNAVERGVLLAPGDEIGAEELGLRTPAGERAGAPAAAPAAGAPAVAPEAGAPVSLAALEEAHIRRVVAAAPSLKEAAAILGIDEATLWRRRKRYGI